MFCRSAFPLETIAVGLLFRRDSEPRRVGRDAHFLRIYEKAVASDFPVIFLSCSHMEFMFPAARACCPAGCAGPSLASGKAKRAKTAHQTPAARGSAPSAGGCPSNCGNFFFSLTMNIHIHVSGGFPSSGDSSQPGRARSGGAARVGVWGGLLRALLRAPRGSACVRRPLASEPPGAERRGGGSGSGEGGRRGRRRRKRRREAMAAPP